MCFLIFDTETTGRAADASRPASDVDNWPRIVQLAWALADNYGRTVREWSFLISPDGWEIPPSATAVHGITTARAQRDGIQLAVALGYFQNDARKARVAVAHNAYFDGQVIAAEYHRLKAPGTNRLTRIPAVCTMQWGTPVCRLPGARTGQYKWPALHELHHNLFGSAPEASHDALADVRTAARCFFRMCQLDANKAELVGFLGSPDHAQTLQG